MQRNDEVWKSDALTRTYLQGVRGAIPFGAEQIEIMLRFLATRAEPVRRFADLGCGDGVLSRAVLGQYPEAQGVLVDFSAPMLEAAKKQLGERASQLRFATADLADPGWLKLAGVDTSLDAVVSGYAIHHLPDRRKRQLYAEIFAHLDRNGVFVNVEHVASATPQVEAMSDDLMIDSLCAFHREREPGKTRADVAREFVHRPDKAANILAPVEVQCRWLRDIGFADVDCYFKAFELAVFGGRRG